MREFLLWRSPVIFLQVHDSVLHSIFRKATQGSPDTVYALLACSPVIFLKTIDLAGPWCGPLGDLSDHKFRNRLAFTQKSRPDAMLHALFNRFALFEASFRDSVLCDPDREAEGVPVVLHLRVKVTAALGPALRARAIGRAFDIGPRALLQLLGSGPPPARVTVHARYSSSVGDRLQELLPLGRTDLTGPAGHKALLKSARSLVLRLDQPLESQIGCGLAARALADRFGCTEELSLECPACFTDAELLSERNLPALLMLVDRLGYGNPSVTRIRAPLPLLTVLDRALAEEGRGAHARGVEGSLLPPLDALRRLEEVQWTLLPLEVVRDQNDIALKFKSFTFPFYSLKMLAEKTYLHLGSAARSSCSRPFPICC